MPNFIADKAENTNKQFIINSNINETTIYNYLSTFRIFFA